jgi:hypothetical protein
MRIALPSSVKARLVEGASGAVPSMHRAIGGQRLRRLDGQLHQPAAPRLRRIERLFADHVPGEGRCGRARGDAHHAPRFFAQRCAHLAQRLQRQRTPEDRPDALGARRKRALWLPAHGSVGQLTARPPQRLRHEVKLSKWQAKPGKAAGAELAMTEMAERDLLADFGCAPRVINRHTGGPSGNAGQRDESEPREQVP